MAEREYPTVEQFCSTFLGDTKGDLPIIAHKVTDGEDFEYLTNDTNEWALLGDKYECAFVHACDLRPSEYMAESYWKARVIEWRIYPDAVHIAIDPIYLYREEQTNG